MQPSSAANPGGFKVASQGDINQAVSEFTGYSGTLTTQQNYSPFYGSMSSYNAKPGVAQSFFGKIGSVFSESAHMFLSAGEWVGKQAIDMGKGLYHELPSLKTFAVDSYHISTNAMAMDSKMSQLNDLNRQRNTGQISQSEYTLRMNSIIYDMHGIAQKNAGMDVKIASDGKQAVKNTIDAAAAVVTVMTAGGLTPLVEGADSASTAAAGKFFGGKAADYIFNNAEAAVSRMSVDAKYMKSLPTSVANSIKDSVTQTFINADTRMTAGQISRATVANMAFKYPLTFNYVSGTGQQFANELQSGKYGEALKSFGFNIALALSGGPIGQAMKAIGSGAKVAQYAIFGEHTFLDTLGKAIGDGNVGNLYNILKNDPAVYKAFQALAATNIKAEGGDSVKAAYRIINGLQANGWHLAESDHQTFVDNVMNWHQAQTMLQERLMKTGMSAEDASRYVVGRWTSQEKNTIAKFLQGQDNKAQAWEDYKSSFPNSAFAHNDNIDRQIKDLIAKSETGDELRKGINNISTAISPKDMPGMTKAFLAKLGDMGYVPITPNKLQAPFIQGTEKIATQVGENSDFFTKAVAPLPGLKEFGTLLTNIGLSPDLSGKASEDILKANVINNLQKTEFAKTETEAHVMLTKLTSYMNRATRGLEGRVRLPINDYRQLTVKELSSALGVDAKDAKTIGKALNQSLLDMSLSERGLGPKITDQLSRALRNNRKIGMQGYLRLQGVGRFAWNPIFRNIKAPIKTDIVASAQERGAVMSFLQGKYPETQKTAQYLEEHNLFTGGFMQEGTSDNPLIRAVTKPIGMTNFQKMSAASVIQAQAEKSGLNAVEFINQNPEEVRNTIESILHYNPQSSMLNSPLAKTLNLAFFPARFDIKVAGYMAKVLTRQSAVVQLAVIHSLYQAHEFMSSEAGMAWYAENSDAIELLKYFSPLQELGTVAAFGGIGHESIGSFGELGGLPLGFIPQILQAEGLWKNSAPAYLDPKTGQPSSQYIPNTSKAALATALTSFVGSLFSWPGSTAGLPSKSGTLAKAARGITGSSSTDWTPTPQTNLTPQQQQYQSVIAGLPANAQNRAASARSISGTTERVPEQNFLNAKPIYTAAELKSKSGKLKKNQEPVSPVAGQTKVGQIL